MLPRQHRPRPARASSVSGTLSPADYHYLGLEPAFTDGTVVLTIALEPSDDEALRGAINFLVLTDDGLRHVLAGADPFHLDIAASAPLQFDPSATNTRPSLRLLAKAPIQSSSTTLAAKSAAITLPP